MREQYTVDSDSDYESDTERQPCKAQVEPMIAPLDLAATRASLRSTSKAKSTTLSPCPPRPALKRLKLLHHLL